MQENVNQPFDERLYGMFCDVFRNIGTMVTMDQQGQRTISKH